ncbi:MAG: tandem-95 repeat protein [Sulfurimonas sp.]|uniref:beta strand repeat-containing protein n=1 Tax=Sulfurimonas sp. TaxID=2022749 RepID=UPI00260FA4FC|nr:tandem-95 repeat protein [Sulfurimonas sp.]MDD5400061.1 tandem-95 repeat protein [Sulfurimonas sp.]
MATGKVIGQIQVAQGNVKVVSVDGLVREPSYDGFVYENEQIISDDPTALFQIKFLALPEASAYDGAFRILADGSVIHGRDAIDSVASDESLVNILKAAASGDVENIKTAAGTDIGDLETAAGEEGVVGSSSFTETDIVAESSVLGFSRGANGALGFGITDFGGRAAPDFAHTPPAISSPNVVVYDENGTQPVIQVTATGESAITYSIGGLDSDKFSIDSGTGLLTFNNSPDYENPQDLSGDNEYNIYVTATDTSGYYTTQLLSVSVNNVNEAPTAMNDTVDAVEDTVLSSTIDLDANDTDVDGSALSVIAGTYATAQGGTLVVAADGSYTYTPAANFHGVDTVNYTVTDGEFSDVGTLTINVASVNDAPVAVDDAVSAVEDTVLSSVIELDANDYDVDGDALSVVAGTFATANGGQLVLASDGSYTYTPAANFNGVDSVNYTVTDGELTDVGTLTINVAAVDDIVTPPANSAPVANVDLGTVAEDGSVVVDILANDTDLDGTIDPTTVVITTNPTNGSISVDALTGAVTYTPNADYNGSDSFAYTVQDNEGAISSPATVSLTVTPVNDAPVAVDDSVTTQEDTVLSSVIDLDANDTDLDGDALSVVAGTFETVQGGEIVIAADGSYTYTPPTNFNGEDSVDYTVTDGELTDVGTLTINVVSVNDAPVAVDDEVNAVEDTIFTSTIDLDANDTDVSGDALSVIPGTFVTAQGGEIVIASDGSYTYTPPTNFNGIDSVNYTVTDGALTDEGTLTINVAPANDAPVANVDSGTAAEDGSVVIDVVANDTDLDGTIDPTTVTITTDPTNGIVSVNTITGEVTYTPNANYVGADSFAYTVQDNEGAVSSPATVSLNVTSVNDAPVANDDTAETQEDTAITLTASDVLSNDTDADGGVLTITGVSNAVNGSVVLNPNGTITFTPASNYHGDGASFDYTITDGQGGTSTATATVNVTVSSVDDTTTLTINAGTVTEDSSVAGDAVATFSVSDMDETPSVGFTSGTNTNGYYGISGNNIILTPAGEAFLDGGGTLPAISLTTSGTSTDISATATPTTILAADPLVVYSELGTVGNPLFNLADFELGDDPDFVNGVSKSYSSNGLVITSDTPLNFNPGHGLGVDTPTDNTGSEAINIDGRYGEELSIDLPSAVFALNIDLKLTGGDLVGIKLYNESGVEITTGISFEKGNGTPLTLTSGGYINGGDLKNGGDTIRIISDVKFDAMDIKDANGSGSQDGFTLVNIYDPMSISGFYTYEYNMDLNLQESNEAVQSVTVSGFDPSIVTKLVFTYDDGTHDEFSSDSTGTITITDSSLLALLSNGDDGDVVITIASQNEIADGFQPIFDAVTVETSDPSLAVSHTILGGTAGDVLTGGEGNDYIEGRDGNDTINGSAGNDTINGGAGADTVYGGAGNDTIVYDIADIEIDGGAGTDTLVANSGAVNLSNISNINIIQLGSGATVVGSGVDGINPSDVINATDDGTLIIQSVDNVSNQVNVDTTLFAEVGNIIIDGIEYAQYTGAGATLLIEETITVD